jgi:antitoxin PrlF
MQATITSKGQVTIPKPVRDALHLEAGDRLEFLVEADGSIRAIPVTGSVTDLKGILPPPARALSLEEMDAAIVAGAADL